MIRLRGFTHPEIYRGGVVSIGNFDGVHRGHQAMMAMLCRRAAELSVPAVVMTFDPHPIAILRPEHTPPPLSTLQRKQDLLERCGVDCTIAYPTDRALLQHTPAEFFQQIVVSELQARGLVEGPNFYFGKDRAGDTGLLETFCEQSGLSLDVMQPVETTSGMISSSTIRHLVGGGKIREAVELLGHPYQVRGIVGTGARRGQTLGFPTANLDWVATLVPAEGVYAGRVDRDGRTYPAAIHVGPSPTFDEFARKLEVHLIGFDGNLYGADLPVDFLSELRPIQKFESADELRMQLERDIFRAKELASPDSSG